MASSMNNLVTSEMLTKTESGVRWKWCKIGRRASLITGEILTDQFSCEIETIHDRQKGQPSYR